MSSPYGLHWFRRDLRLDNNRLLIRQFKKFGGRVVGVFFFDSKFLSRDDFSHHRFQFFLETMKELSQEMESRGGKLLVFDELPQIGFERIFKNCLSAPCEISFNRDYEPFARERDSEVKSIIEQYGARVTTGRDHLFFEPSQILKDDGTPYRVYTPFFKSWYRNFCEVGIPAAETFPNSPFSIRAEDVFSPVLLQDHLERFRTDNAKKVTISIPKAGRREGLHQLEAFVGRVAEYKDKRDFPYENGTSSLSHFLKNGSLTVEDLIQRLSLGQIDESQKGPFTYLKELVWREFYYHVMYHFPESENEEFQKKYVGMPWEFHEEYLQAWKQGQTGYPIVDAGMRQLMTTGFMHNRVRMIVASFLTKHLLMDWRLGAEHFMRYLLDGDLAANTGGWQWAASTGCDAQPYFRVFNPWTQSQKFDVSGEYIKKYVPELEKTDFKNLHKPLIGHKNYPEPIVEHSTARVKAIEHFKMI